ncbi:MAG: B12-binding domain-containing radical SAM protein [Candidatus Muiribacteriota bacterium]
MKVLFVYPESGYNKWNNISFKNGRYYHGVGILSSFLKSRGHETALCHILSKFKEKQVKHKIQQFKPDLICVSSTTHMLGEIIKIDEFLFSEYKNIPGVIGGAIVSVEPELVHKFKYLKRAVVGDGELAIINILKNIEKKLPAFKGIPNVYTKGDKSDIKVKCIKDLNTIPFADREIFEFEKLDDYKWFKRLPVITSRGCRFSCSFCVNSALKKFYAKDDFMRFRSPENIVSEILKNLKKYPEIDHIQFQSDLFFKNIDWLKKFKKEYKKVNLPFHCLLRVEQVNNQVLHLLKKSGCELILMGVESGDDNLRLKTGKNLKRKKIIKAFEKIKKFNIKSGTFNIMGLPGESLDSVLESFKINADINPDLAQISIFYPYKNTDIYDNIKNMIRSDKNCFKTYFEKSLLEKKYLIKDFYFYYKNFLKFTQLYKYFKSPFQRKLLDVFIKSKVVNKKIISKVNEDIFRIIF